MAIAQLTFIQWQGRNILIKLITSIVRKIFFFQLIHSTSEFAVSTKILRNEQNAGRSNHGNDFQVSLSFLV